MDYRPDAGALVAAFASSDFSRDEDAWNQAVDEDKTPDALAIPEPDADGNYHSPFQNRVIQLFEDLNDDKIEPAAILETLTRGLQWIEMVAGEMTMYAEMGIDDPNNVLTQAFKLGFEEHKSAVRTLQQYLETRDENLLQQGMVELQKATNRSMDAYAFFQRLRVAANTVLCPKCEAENRRGTAKCTKCLTDLPGAEEKTEATLLAVAAEGVLVSQDTIPLTTPNYQRMEAAMAAWEAQDLDDATLLVEVEAIEANMLAHRAANEAERADLEDLTEDEQKIMTQLLDGVEVALEANIQAITRMKLYFEDNDPDNLRLGMQALGVATQQIIEAFMASQVLMDQSAANEAAG